MVFLDGCLTSGGDLHSPMELFRTGDLERSESGHVGQPYAPAAQGEADVLLRGAQQPRLYGLHDEPPVHPVWILKYLQGVWAPFHIRYIASTNTNACFLNTNTCFLIQILFVEI